MTPRKGGERAFVHRLFRVNLAVLLGLCSLLPALYVNSAAGFFPACLFAAGLLCSLGAAGAGALALRLRVLPPDVPPTRGQPCGMVLLVQNRGPFPLPRVQVSATLRVPGGQTLCERFCAPLAPGETARFVLRAALAHAGVYTCASVRLSANDLTGLFTLCRRVRTGVSLTAGPRVRGAAVLAAPPAGAAGAAGRAQARRAAAGLYSGVRDYAAGDPLRGIHWKLTAHTGAFLSRVYEGAQKPPFCAVLCLVPEADTADEFDCLLERPLGAAREALEAGCDVTLLFEENGVPALCRINTARELESFGRRLAGQPGRTLDASALLAVLPGGAALLCTARLTDSLRAALLAPARAENRPALLWVSGLPEDAREARLTPLRGAGVDARAVFCPPPSPAGQTHARRKRGRKA